MITEYEENIIKKAVLLEEQGKEFYRMAGEQEHVTAFSGEYQLLQEEWWSRQNFEPF